MSWCQLSFVHRLKVAISFHGMALEEGLLRREIRLHDTCLNLSHPECCFHWFSFRLSNQETFHLEFLVDFVDAKAGIVWKLGSERAGAENRDLRPLK